MTIRNKRVTIEAKLILLLPVAVGFIVHTYFITKDYFNYPITAKITITNSYASHLPSFTICQKIAVKHLVCNNEGEKMLIELINVPKEKAKIRRLITEIGSASRPNFTELIRCLNAERILDAKPSKLLNDMHALYYRSCLRPSLLQYDLMKFQLNISVRATTSNFYLSNLKPSFSYIYFNPNFPRFPGLVILQNSTIFCSTFLNKLGNDFDLSSIRKLQHQFVNGYEIYFHDHFIEWQKLFVNIHSSKEFFPKDNFPIPEDSYSIFFYKSVHVRLLPPPYHTNCEDKYSLDKVGYQSQNDCKAKCLVDIWIKMCGCLVGHSVLRPQYMREHSNGHSHKTTANSSHDFHQMCKILSKSGFIEETFGYSEYHYECIKRNITILWIPSFNINEKIEACESKCLDNCEKLEYTYKLFFNKRNGDNSLKSKSSRVQNGTLIAKVIPNRSGVISYTHSPSMDTISLLSNIGGLLGLWLALSVIQVFQVLLVSSHFFLYLCKPAQTSLNTHSHIDSFDRKSQEATSSLLNIVTFIKRVLLQRLMVLSLFVGLCICCSQITFQYLQYDTKIDLILEQQKKVEIPSATLCVQLESPEVFVAEEEEKEYFLRLWKKRNVEINVPFNVTLREATKSMRVLKYSIECFSDVNACDDVFSLEYISQVVETFSFNPPTKCFTYNSKLGRNFDVKKSTSSFQQNIVKVMEARLSGDHEWTRYINIYGLHFTTLFCMNETSVYQCRYSVSFHSNNYIPQIYNQKLVPMLHNLKRTKKNMLMSTPYYSASIIFSTTTYDLLSPPYKTMCKLYNNEGEENNAKSSNDCIDKCLIEKVKNVFNCTPKFVRVQLSLNNINDKLCDNIASMDLKNFVNICRKKCPTDCKQVAYRLNDERKRRLNENRGNRKLNPVFDVELVVKDSRQPIYSHFPKITFTEFLCNIGGVCGIWLGLSIFDAIELVSNIVLHLQLLALKLFNGPRFARKVFPSPMASRVSSQRVIEVENECNPTTSNANY